MGDFLDRLRVSYHYLRTGAEALAHSFLFARVDRFGEVTFYPQSGFFFRMPRQLPAGRPT